MSGNISVMSADMSLLKPPTTKYDFTNVMAFDGLCGETPGFYGHIGCNLWPKISVAF